MRWSWPERGKHVWKAAQSLLQLRYATEGHPEAGSAVNAIAPEQPLQPENAQQHLTAGQTSEGGSSKVLLGDAATAALDEILERTNAESMEMDLGPSPPETPI